MHVTTDIPSEHVLVALTNPSRVHIYRKNPDGSFGEQVADEIDMGSYVHQVRVRPNNRTVIAAILVSRHGRSSILAAPAK